MHICVSQLTIIGSDNGLSPGRHQAIIWTNAGILLIGPSGRNLSEIVIEILTFSFKKMRLKVPLAKWRPFCLGLNVLTQVQVNWLAAIHIHLKIRVLRMSHSLGLLPDSIKPLPDPMLTYPQWGPLAKNSFLGYVSSTHLPLDKMAAIWQTIFLDAFSWMKSFVFWLKFHLGLFPRVQLTITQHWFR